MPSINSMYNPTTHLLEEQDDTIPLGIEVVPDNNQPTPSREKQLQNFENEDDEVCNSCAELCINIACYVIISLMGIVAIGLIVISFF